MLKLPRCLEADPLSAKIESVLASNHRLLWGDGTLKAAHFELNEPLIRSLSLARRCGHLKGGLENIEMLLQREEAGLVALQKREKTEGANRISRLIFLSDDGSPRFYRACESLLTKYSGRALGLRLNVNGGTIGKNFFGKDTLVKIVMVEHRDSVAKVLLSLVDG